MRFIITSNLAPALQVQTTLNTIATTKIMRTNAVWSSQFGHHSQLFNHSKHCTNSTITILVLCDLHRPLTNVDVDIKSRAPVRP